MTIHRLFLIRKTRERKFIVGIELQGGRAVLMAQQPGYVLCRHAIVKSSRPFVHNGLLPNDDTKGVPGHALASKAAAKAAPPLWICTNPRCLLELS